MTVKELEAILHNIKERKAKVLMVGYYDTEVNGCYTLDKDGETVLYLTHHNI